jgi:hypothetical protein
MLALEAGHSLDTGQVIRKTAAPIAPDQASGSAVGLIDGHAARSAFNSTFWYSIADWRLWLAISVAAVLAMGAAFILGRPGGDAVLPAGGIAASGAVVLYLLFGYAFAETDAFRGIMFAMIVFGGLCGYLVAKLEDAIDRSEFVSRGSVRTAAQPAVLPWDEAQPRRRPTPRRRRRCASTCRENIFRDRSRSGESATRHHLEF